MRSRYEGLTSRFTAAMLSGLLALTSVGPALAQGKPPAAAKAAKKEKKLTDKQAKEEAKKRFKEGKELFDKGDFAGAAAAFQDADHLVPGPMPKYKFAVSLDKQNKTADAIDAYQKFLDSSPDADKFKEQIADAKGREDALKNAPGKIRVVTDPAAPPNLKLAVDGTAKTGAEFPVDPGHHTLTATADGFDPASQEFDLKTSEAKDLQVKLNASAVAAVPPPPPPVASAAAPPPPAATGKVEAAPSEPSSRVPAYVTLGLAVVGAGVGTVFGVQALGSKRDYNAAPTSAGLDKVERQSLLADMCYAVALTFGVTGVVLLLSNDDAPAPKQANGKPSKPSMLKAVSPYVTPTGGGAAATLRF